MVRAEVLAAKENLAVSAASRRLSDYMLRSGGDFDRATEREHARRRLSKLLQVRKGLTTEVNHSKMIKQTEGTH